MDHYDKCVLLLPMRGANDGTAFPDYSVENITLTRAGDAKTVTSTYKYYDSSAYFDGTGDQLYLANAAADPRFTFGTADFTIACWIKLPENPAAYGYLISFYPQNAAGVCANIQISPTRYPFLLASGGTIWLTASSALPLDTWAHLEWSRVSGRSYLFIDGVAAGDAADTRDYVTGSNRPTIATSGFAYGTANLKCYLQDFAVWKGVGLHTQGFTPPARLVAPVSNSGSGIAAITDDTGTAAVRKVHVSQRNASASAGFKARTFVGESDANGRFEIWAPTAESNVILLDDTAGTAYSDILVSKVAVA